jgi:hypothetical protein
MKTDDLIKAIAADAAASMPSVGVRMTAALAAGGSVAVALFVLNLGVRPDVLDALQTWRFDTKLAIALLTFAGALWATARLARPDADRRLALAALLLPLLALAIAAGWELSFSPVATWSARAIGSNSKLCVVSIIAMSIAPLSALLLALRAGAPSSPGMAGAAAGLAAGGLAATLYATHCTDDSPMFVALWYIPAVLVITLVGAAAGRRVLRW